MPDPFQSLRAPVVPVPPDPAFAARLRARLARALDLPKGVTVSDLHLTEDQPAATTRAVITPYLCVADAEAALDWYGRALGARRRGEPIVMPDGRIGHAELDLAGVRVMLSDESPAAGVAAPDPDRGAAVTLHFEVDDVDAVLERAVAAGADLTRAAADYDYGRLGVVVDPFGHRWMIAGQPRAARLRHGDIGYASLWVPDVDRAAAFYSAVLGWRYAAGSGARGYRTEGLARHYGLARGDASTLFCAYAVADVDAAVEAVRAAGGTAGEPEDRPYGRLADCVDDQGTRFALYQPPGGVADGPPPGPGGHGELTYVTMELVDADRARAFYGAVLGWRFAPGNVPEGWQVEGPSPMVGLWGGRARAVTVPLFRVDDIDAAVRAVRAAGGTATDPEANPYGTNSNCRDDQGTRFDLSQF